MTNLEPDHDDWLCVVEGMEAALADHRAAMTHGRTVDPGPFIRPGVVGPPPAHLSPRLAVLLTETRVIEVAVADQRRRVMAELGTLRLQRDVANRGEPSARFVDRSA